MRLAVIVPAGPGDDVADTLASVIHYTVPSRIVVVVDDTRARDGGPGRFGGPWPDTVVLPAPPGAPGGHGGLWVKLAAGYRWILDRYEPGVILRLDADALVIGAGLESEAERAFSRDPAVGMLGSYRIGPDGGLRDTSWASRQLRIETGLRGLLWPKRRSALRRSLELPAVTVTLTGKARSAARTFIITRRRKASTRAAGSASRGLRRANSAKITSWRC